MHKSVRGGPQSHTVDQMKGRDIGLDFLRGLAILLVLFRHQPLSELTTRLGWIGVDLFFVLSGFLVSGLLFKEFKKTGRIDYTRFLIRRGFKIYPLYYITYLLYVPFLFADDHLNLIGLLSDLTFLQNYLWGWGYAYSASWSLAVEEHFYFLLCIVLWTVLKYRSKILVNNIHFLPGIAALIMLGCLTMRMFSVMHSDTFRPGNFTRTHLRIDSLFLGVAISYFYNFQIARFKAYLSKFKYFLCFISVSCLAWTPFIEPVGSMFVLTVGFSLTSISFGIILSYLVTSPNASENLMRVLSPFIIKIIARIGFSSYAIYLTYSAVLLSLYRLEIPFYYAAPGWLIFLVSASACILFGMTITYSVEKYFLGVRDRFYPSNS
ncbi:acyltransferase [Chryseolinea sp. T2]|uniref:acyltransferase family protein n=1 Tax=Chryseolinea sp. T2 TaxID=3129255 RepID=UPI003076BBC2